jgi:hypothetical protein
MESTVNTETSRAGSRTGSGCSSTALTKLNMAVLRPIPRASEATVTAANVGLFRKPRREYSKSRVKA